MGEILLAAGAGIVTIGAPCILPIAWANRYWPAQYLVDPLAARQRIAADRRR